MADNCVLPTMSGMSNFPCQDMAFLETVPSVPITIGITVTLDALWILLISNARSWYLSTFSSSVLMIFWSAGTAMLISVHSCVSFRIRVISGRLWFSFLSVQTVMSQVMRTSLFFATVKGWWLYHLSVHSIPYFLWPPCHGASVSLECTSMIL